MKTLLITCIKNEASFLLDWVAHHLSIGFTHILVFTNDCEDGSEAMADRLQQIGPITHLPNPAPWRQGPQWAALRRAQTHPAYLAADWVMMLDVDEFVMIKQGQGRLQDLLRARPEVDAFTLCWRIFGNDGQFSRQDRSIIDCFTACAPEVLHWPWRAQMVKTLFRRTAFGQLGIHRPHGATGTPIWSNPSWGDKIYAPNGFNNYGLGQINHYPLGAMDDYLIKVARGRANRQANTSAMDYWCERNFCAAADFSIQAIDNGQWREKLRQDQGLCDLHQAAEAWRRHRFVELMRDEANRALLGKLLMTPPTQPLTPEVAAFLRQPFHPIS